jgi:hypothetical protein
MTSDGSPTITAVRRADSTFGFWAALGTCITTLVTFLMAILTPPLSGPLCKEDCFDYPYLAVAARFPRDYGWMFSAVPATLLYVAFMLALQARVRPERRLVGELGVVLCVMGALTLLGDYAIQLAVIQPSLLAGETDGISLLTQYNPHGVFIALEELGYLFMSGSLACMALALPSSTRLEQAVRWLFAAGLVAALAALAYFMIQYGHRREYLFEIAVISIVWLTLIPGTFMMAAVFRRDIADSGA